MNPAFSAITSTVDEAQTEKVSGGAAWAEAVFINNEVNDAGLDNIRSVVDMDPTGNTTGNASDHYQAEVDTGGGNLTGVPISQAQFNQILDDQNQQDPGNVDEVFS